MRIWEKVLGELGPQIGVARDLHAANYALKQAARAVAAPVVGAMHVRCSDEAERESVEAFQAAIAQDLLPRLKFANRSSFSSSNLGGRYEWGSLAIAEDHFATPESRASFKLMIVKMNAHVGVRSTATGPEYGLLQRYGLESTCCGLLHAVVGGRRGPSIDPVTELFAAEGVDRLAQLEEVGEPWRMLAAAIANARLQARCAVLEAQENAPRTPTVYLVLPGVTLNRSDRDNELLVGVYLIDRRGRGAPAWYQGLGDQPAGYRIEPGLSGLRVGDASDGERRPARDHRALIRDSLAAREETPFVPDPRIDALLDRAAAATDADRALDSVLLKGLLLVLTEVSPVSAALLLFGEGAMEIYRAWEAHRVVREVESSDEARRMLAELHARVDSMPAEEVERVLKVLLTEYRPGGSRRRDDGESAPAESG